MFTLIHVGISVLGLVAGLVVVGGLVANTRLATWTAIYLNVFVPVAQLFARVPAMRELARTQAEPPFAVTQALMLAVSVWLGRAAVMGFRGGR